MHDEFKAGDIGGVADYIAKMRKRPPRIKDLHERRKKRRKKLKKKAEGGLPTKVRINDPRPMGVHDLEDFEDPHQAFAWARRKVEPIDGLVIQVIPMAYEQMEDGSVIDRIWTSRDGADFTEEIAHRWADVKAATVFAKLLKGPDIVPYFGDFSAMMKVATFEDDFPEFMEFAEDPENYGAPRLPFQELVTKTDTWPPYEWQGKIGDLEVSVWPAEGSNALSVINNKNGHWIVLIKGVKPGDLAPFFPPQLAKNLVAHGMGGSEFHWETHEETQQIFDILQQHAASILANIPFAPKKASDEESGPGSSEAEDAQTRIDTTYCREAKEYWGKAPAKTKSEKAAVKDFVEYVGQVSCRPPKTKKAHRELPATAHVQVIGSIHDLSDPYMPTFVSLEKFDDFGAALKWADSKKGERTKVALIADFYDEKATVKNPTDLAAKLAAGQDGLVEIDPKEASKLSDVRSVAGAIARANQAAIQVCRSARVELQSNEGAEFEEKGYEEKVQKHLWWDDGGQLFQLTVHDEVQDAR